MALQRKGFLEAEPFEHEASGIARVAVEDLNANQQLGYLETLCLANPTVPYEERVVKELGQVSGNRQNSCINAKTVNKDYIQQMKKANAPSRASVAGQPGFNYILDEGLLEFGATSTLQVSTRFNIRQAGLKRENTDQAMACGFVVGPVSASFSMFRREVLGEGDGEVKSLGEFEMAVLRASGSNSVLLWDEAKSLTVEHGDTHLMEFWEDVAFWGHDAKEQKDVNEEDVKKLAFDWIRGGPRRVCNYLPKWRTMWYKDLTNAASHPVCTYHKDVKFEKGWLLFSSLMSNPVSSQPCIDDAKLAVRMDLFLYESKKFAWLAWRILDSTFYKRLELKEPLDEEGVIPPGIVGTLIKLPEPSDGFGQIPITTSTVRVVRAATDLVELWTTRSWVRLQVSFQVLGFWASATMCSTLVVETLVPSSSEHLAETSWYCFASFVAATIVLIWLEVRLSLCCEQGRKLCYTRTFGLALALSCLEKYDVYSDLNFVAVARKHRAEPWVWKISFGIVVVGVGVMQLLPSLLLLSSCLSSRVAQLGIPRDFSLLTRFSGMHLLMQSISSCDGLPQAVFGARARPDAECDGSHVEEMGAKLEKEQRTLAQEAEAPESAQAFDVTSPTPTETAGFHLPQQYCDVPHWDDASSNELQRKKDLARVKRFVGAVRFACEDLLQGVMQLLFLAARWPDLETFEKVQVIASVLFGIASSALGPFMETRELIALSRKLRRHDAWLAFGGAICNDIRKVQQEHGGGGHVRNLRFDKPMRIVGSVDVDQPAEVLHNGTRVRVREVIKGKVDLAPQSSYPNAITQLILVVGDAGGGVVHLEGLYDRCPGRNPGVREHRFEIRAPDKPGTYTIAWVQDLEMSMAISMRKVKNVSADKIQGYIFVVSD
ncbi:unnamed protein product [Symbiodinium sp. CCMP2592]|nr:unnamed protein product [Symbiodinium sp. CCMP2592]